jgi:tol-pal system protein YbgF
LEYRIDSLQNENRRMKDQLDAVSAENRRLTAKNAELETKAAEPTTAPAPATAPTGTVAPASSEVRGGYEAALEQFRSKNYRAAIEQFDALLKSGSEQLADNCHYWIGESYYGLKEYNDAIKHFEMVFNYKQSGKKPYAQLMIGNAYASLGNATAAREAYNKVINDYPASSLVAKAQAKLAKLK